MRSSEEIRKEMRASARQAFRIYQEHALDELHLMQFHAMELGRNEAEKQKIESSFLVVQEQIRSLTKLLPQESHVPE